MSYATHSPCETAIENWNHALQTYRASVDVYTRAVKIKRRRETRVLPTLGPVGATGAREFAPPPSPPILDKLTPREREVASLIARGFSNRRIAHDLAITQGTAANHVAHIIVKLGLANRTRIAAAVAAAQANAGELSSDFELTPIVGYSTARTKPSPHANFLRLSDQCLADAGRSARTG